MTSKVPFQRTTEIDRIPSRTDGPFQMILQFSAVPQAPPTLMIHLPPVPVMNQMIVMNIPNQITPNKVIRSLSIPRAIT